MEARVQRHSSETRDPSPGFSLVEVVLAMFVLALLSIALLPLLIGSMDASRSNRSISAATAFASARISEVRSAFRDEVATPCAALSGYADAANFYLAGPTGSGLTSRRTLTSSCPSEPFGTVGVRVTVYRVGDLTNPVVTLDTEVVVSS